MPAMPGVATWRTRQFGDVRVRLVEYSPGYVADHWCQKGHILFCVEGELVTDLEDGRSLHAEARHELPGGRRRRAASLAHRPRVRGCSSWIERGWHP